MMTSSGEVLRSSHETAEWATGAFVSSRANEPTSATTQSTNSVPSTIRTGLQNEPSIAGTRSEGDRHTSMHIAGERLTPASQPPHRGRCRPPVNPTYHV